MLLNVQLQWEGGNSPKIKLEMMSWMSWMLQSHVCFSRCWIKVTSQNSHPGIPVGGMELPCTRGLELPEKGDFRSDFVEGLPQVVGLLWI